ncbi:MAG: Gfo/Idh/MocA family oxidoreductase [Chloroflexi bacterium]|nr:Gfo/Idh/MocA family oxidoreductase [Ardenticatenaceae bacterium]MBL1128891.1 gfo/Idh/MocA family oxidoreductase [Chloroflexota bacterium]NOG34970.1 Gfo/Idh/MocA family oxidoreductase [Chloroflexota bacterium]GIK55206.1 MAG: oxidoreductase [Chloroflexota bacterium]
MTTDKIRWGILGTGVIARKFAEGLAVLPDAVLTAVGSRNEHTAAAFATQYHVPHAHASYKALAKNPEVDVIYIATPHVFHMENSLLCLQHGKAVLCEKPFTMNRRQAEAIFALTEKTGLFVMEAMWTCFLPAITMVRQLLQDGVIGQVRMLTADFGYRTAMNPYGRHFAPTLGGGALLDVGIYPLALAHMVFGAPTQITGLAHLGETGVDEQAAIILGYKGGELALLHTAVRTETVQEAVIMGTNGRIKIHFPWWQPTRLTLTLSGQAAQDIELPFLGNGYNYEAAAVMDCLRSGQTQHPLMPWSTTLALQDTMDKIRTQWGLRYPADEEM